ncbi:MAG: peroxiredoxin [Clostridiales bacterium]|nr:peroxiredoxin [Clostridiales bacterium]
MPLINKKLDEFKVQSFYEGQFQEVTRDHLEGHWSVFVFYPADFTFVCPTELGDLADHYEEFKAIGCEVYSVSTDTHFVHKAWADTSDTIKKIKFPMLADPTGTLARMFDVLIEEEGLALRGTFIVNPEGVIKAIEVNDNSIGRDAQQLLRKVQAAQFVAAHGDQVCPAKWKPGKEALSPSLDLIGKI